MLIQRVNRDDPEKVFISCQNDDGSSSWVAGEPVFWQADGTDDGLDAVSGGTDATSSLLIGVADTTTADQGYGLVQVYGVRTDAVINQAGTASDANGAIGDVLAPWTASSAFSGVAAGAATGFLPSVVLMETVASSSAVATTTGTVFLRCM